MYSRLVWACTCVHTERLRRCSCPPWENMLLLLLTGRHKPAFAPPVTGDWQDWHSCGSQNLHFFSYSACATHPATHPKTRRNARQFPKSQAIFDGFGHPKLPFGRLGTPFGHHFGALEHHFSDPGVPRDTQGDTWECKHGFCIDFRWVWAPLWAPIW